MAPRNRELLCSSLFPVGREGLDGWRMMTSDCTGVSDGMQTDKTCRFENRVRVGGREMPSERCSNGGEGLDWRDRQVGLIWSLVR
jgi:hypothetical protein